VVIRITIPGDPVAWARARRCGNLYFVDAKTAAFKARVASAGRDAMADAPPLEGPCEVVIHARLPIPKSWSKRKIASAVQGGTRPTHKLDWDNIAKGIGDALNEIVWKDDGQIVDGRVIKYYAAEPCVFVEVSAV
jgi:Holliday junction resolvase RusA-like endonuclease